MIKVVKMVELEKCPFCGENNISLLYFNVYEQETKSGYVIERERYGR